MRPTKFARLTFPNSGIVFRGPSTFPLISFPRLRYYMRTQVIYKITAFFDNLTRAQPLASPTNKAKTKTFAQRFAVVPKGQQHSA